SRNHPSQLLLARPDVILTHNAASGAGNLRRKTWQRKENRQQGPAPDQSRQRTTPAQKPNMRFLRTTTRQSPGWHILTGRHVAVPLVHPKRIGIALKTSYGGRLRP